jgi:addiction module HigA family antidote
MSKVSVVSPAVILKEKFMDQFQLKPAALAKGINTNPAVISNVLNGKQRITIPLALRLAKFFKTPDAYWTDLQYQYDLIKITQDPKFKAAIQAIKAVEKPKPVKAAAAKSAANKAPPAKKAGKAPKSGAAKGGRKPKAAL